ncbi:MAG: hypothetical protein RAO92_09910 [Candidatus Euphemobacter frigidus]|nr:hypothetical protein [Candidatus Euphemobacter frigidus]MDP8276697.1 hypothetical protein [Candidatus Euphemobacter frigidus]
MPRANRHHIPGFIWHLNSVEELAQQQRAWIEAVLEGDGKVRH